jgi:hypothetical protein
MCAPYNSLWSVDGEEAVTLWAGDERSLDHRPGTDQSWSPSLLIEQTVIAHVQFTCIYILSNDNDAYTCICQFYNTNSPLDVRITMEAVIRNPS